MAALAVAALAAGCTGAPTVGEKTPASAELDVAVASEMATQPADLVDITVYLRSGRGADARLVPVRREVPVGPDLPRRAMDLLIEGPRRSDGDGLHRPLPETTRVRSLDVSEGTVTVDLSRHVVEDRRMVARSAADEALALAAIADTLTEFPDVTDVRLLVEGKPASRFWGTWGAPEILVRDESLIGDSPDGAPDIARFNRAPQRAGTRVDSAVELVAVAAEARTTFLRVVLEFADDGRDDHGGVVPRSRVRRLDGRIVLDVQGVSTHSVKELTRRRQATGSPRVRTARGPRPDTLRVVVEPADRPEFLLHTLTEPARLVLDVRS